MVRELTEDERKAQRDAEQAALEDEMVKRRERVKAWQESRSKRDAVDSAPIVSVSAPETAGTAESETNGQAAPPTAIGWSLDDDGEEEEESGEPANDSLANDAVEAIELVGNNSIGMSRAISSEFVPLIPKGDDNAALDNDEGGDGVFAIPAVRPRKSLNVQTIAVSLKSPVKKSTTDEIKEKAVGAQRPLVSASVLQPPNAIHQSTVAAAIAVAAPQTTSKEEEPEFDPLDAFMTELYGASDLPSQQNDPPFPQRRPEDSRRQFNAAAAPRKSVSFSSSISSTRALSDDDRGTSEDEDDYAAEVNPYGTNVITLEEIMGTVGAIPKDALKSSAMEIDNSSGDSSSNGLTTETEEERELREEQERQEFVEAIRKARQLEEQSREGQDVEHDDTDVAGSTAADAAAKKEDDLGIVMAGEGDVLDESEIEAKKKSALELLEEQRKGKELKPVDHSQIKYMAFRKNLYIVPKALARLSDAEVQARRDSLHVKVRGRGCPCPVDTWEQCGLSDRVLDVITQNDFKAPFAIQKQAIPAIMCGRDVIGVAKTGSGKCLR